MALQNFGGTRCWYAYCAVRCDGEAGSRCVAHSQGDTGKTDNAGRLLSSAGSGG
ncbi:Uncharacterised protein [Mycobacteroides abscessus subsp. massiliense]|nr:Uncharacterised protein [Mycobacteroides abscessus subsp. massiliense]